MRLFAFIVLSFMFLSGSTNAFIVDIQVNDINTRANLENVITTVYNGDGNILNTSLTNSDGLISFHLNETWSQYEYEYQKLGYHTKIENATNTTNIIYQTLNPISDDGIVKIVFGDALFVPDRRFCIFFQNGRLEGCYQLNDTVKLLVNQQYTVIPKTEITDTLSSFDNLRNNTKNIAFIVISFLMVAVLMMALYGKLVKGGRRR